MTYEGSGSSSILTNGSAMATDTSGGGWGPFGIKTYSNSWNMQISFGGIAGSESKFNQGKPRPVDNFITLVVGTVVPLLILIIMTLLHHHGASI